VFGSNGLENSIWQPLCQKTNPGGIAGEETAGECVDLIIRNAHGCFVWLRRSRRVVIIKSKTASVSFLAISRCNPCHLLVDALRSPLAICPLAPIVGALARKSAPALW